MTPVLDREEYVEQAYFFRVCRERILDGRPAQEVLEHLDAELLSSTKLPMAVGFLCTELKHTGQLGAAVARLPHYFTPFQAHVITQAEDDGARFTMEQSLVVLEREAEYRSDEPRPAGLFVYQLETLSRNRLGYTDGLRAMQQDGFYDEFWRQYIGMVRSRLGEMDFAELLFARSQHYVNQRRRSDPDYQPKFSVLFHEKEGKIAQANIGKDPMFLFATLQRQLAYPEVPRPTRGATERQVVNEMQDRIKNLETRVQLLEAELRGQLDISQFYVNKANDAAK